MKQKSYEERSVFAYMQPGETYEEAEQRLKRLWEKGEHPVQLQRRRDVDDS